MSKRPTASRIALDLGDLELSSIEVQVLASTEALGLPELGATNGSPNCCSNACCGNCGSCCSTIT